jgi:hypothetical protein
MRVIERAAIVLLTFSLCASAQVLSPQEIRDPQMRALQEKYLTELKAIAQAASTHSFPYRFYFSRALDLAEKDQAASDQRSIQFDRYQGKVVVKITGNYFASYSTTLMTGEERARQTYQDVMRPLLQAAAPALLKADEVQDFAFEISHHVRKKILGVTSEGVENVVLILPRASAERFARAANITGQEAALAEGDVFLNAVPISLWGHAELVSANRDMAPVIAKPTPQPAAGVAVVTPASPPSAANRPAGDAASFNNGRDTSPEAIRNIQKLYQEGLDRMVQELDSQAHFVRFAPPAFIPFHKGLYLQVSLNTTLPESANGSQYKLAALAFDRHVAHLIRPVLSALREDRADFDGIDFSTSLRLSGDPSPEGGGPWQWNSSSP